MTARLRMLALVVLFLMAQSALFYRFRVAGVVPDAMLLLAVCAGVVGGPARGAIVGFMAGMAWDLQLLTTPEGLSALVFALVGYATGVVMEGSVRPAWWFPVVAVAVASAAGAVMWALAAAVVGHPDLVTTRLVRIAAVVALWNAILAPAALRAVGWAVAQGAERRVAVR